MGEFIVKSSKLMALLMLIAAAFLPPASGMAQQNTAFSGPVSIQSNNATNSALEVSRQGYQPAAISSFTNGGGDAWDLYTLVGNQQVRRSFFNDSGAFYSNSWAVISGTTSNAGTAYQYPLFPTNDSFMLGLWSDITGPALVLRPNATSHPDPTLGSQDNYGNYRMAIFPDGTLQFAGPGSTSGGFFGAGTPFAQTSFDTVLHRVGPGQLRTEGSFSATSIADTPSTVTLLNDSNAQTTPGCVVSADPARDLSYVMTSSDADPTVIGVAPSTISSGQRGGIAVGGVALVNVSGQVSRGALLVSAGSAPGMARALGQNEQPAPGAVIGKALSANSNSTGQVQALLLLR